MTQLKDIDVEDRIGLRIADLLQLRMIRQGDQAGRYRTTWGSKTPKGLYLTVKRVIENSEQELKGQQPMTAQEIIEREG